MAESKAQKQDHGVDEQETTATSINPRVVDIRQEWDWVKVGIEEVLREHPQLTFRPEDVYTACVTEAALLWVAPEGFVVTTGETDNFTGDRTLLIWIAWAEERGIYDKGDAKTQYVKLAEEFGELAKALLKDDQPEVIDAIGDIVVVLTNLAKLGDLNIEDCIQSAYNVIAKALVKWLTEHL